MKISLMAMQKNNDAGFNFLLNSHVCEFSPSEVKVQRIFCHLNFYFDIIFPITL